MRRFPIEGGTGMMRNWLESARRAFSTEAPDVVLAAQLRELRGQLPTIYLGMAFCSLFVAAMFFSRAPVLVSLAEAIFLGVAAWRSLHWRALRVEVLTREEMREALRRLNLLALGLGLFCSTVVFCADRMASPEEKIALVLWAAYCGVGSGMSLSVYKPACRLVMTLPIVPYAAFLTATDAGAGRVVALILLVAIPVGVAQYARMADFFRALTLRNADSAAAAREAEARQRSFLEAASDWAWEFDAEKRLTYVSQAFVDFFGTAREALIGRTLKEFSERFGMRLLSAPFDPREAIEQRLPYRDAIYEVPTPGSKPAYVSSAAQPRFAPDGAFLGYIGWTSDVTAVYEAQQALRAGEERFRDFAESASDWFWESDADLRYSWVSEHAEARLGISMSVLIGARMGAVGSTFAPGERERFVAALSERSAFRDVRFYVTANGEPLWLAISGVPMTDASGAFRGYRGVCRNIDAEVATLAELQRHRAELAATNIRLEIQVADRTAEIAKRNAFLDEVIASTPDGLVVYDENMIIEASNAAAVSLSGLPAELWAPGADVRRLVAIGARHGAYDFASVEEYAEAMHASIAERGYFSTIRRQKDGRIISERVSRRTGGGHVTTHTDITELKRLQEIATAQSAQLKEIVASMPDGLCVIDDEFVIVAHNAACVELSGLPKEVWAEGRSVLDLLAIGIRAGLYDFATPEAYGKAMREGIAARGWFSTLRRQRDGRIVSEHIGRRPSGGYIVNYRDVSALKCAEDEAKARTALLDEVFESMAEGVLVLDEDTKIVAASKRCAELSGTTPELWRPGSDVAPLLDIAVANRSYGDSTAETYVAGMFAGLARDGGFHTTRRQSDGRVVAESVRARPNGGVVITYHDITDLKLREAELDAKSEELRQQMVLLREVITSMAEGLLVVDSLSTVVVANDKCAALTGTSPEIWRAGGNAAAMLSDFVAKGLYPAYATVEAYVASMFEGLQSRNLFHAVRHQPDGRVILENVRKRPAGGCVVTYSDITDMCRREEELAAKSDELAARTALLDEVFESMAEGLLVLDADGEIVAANDKCAALSDDPHVGFAPGANAHDILASLIAKGFYSYATLAEYLFAMRRSLDREGVFTTLRRQSDGRVILENVRRRPNGGEVVTFHDVTDRTRREEELASLSEELGARTRLLDEVIETMAQGLMVCGPDLRIIRTNSKAIAMSGGSARDWAPGRSVGELIRAYVAEGAYDYDSYDAYMAAARTEFDAGRVWRARRRQANGRTIEETVRRREGGGFVATYADVTDETMRRQQLERLTEELTLARDSAEAGARAKSQFLANMSHEIRTPMNGVIGMASLLLESGLSQKQAEMAQVIVSSGDNLLTIINDILDLSRLEAGKLAIVEEPFDLRSVVEDVAALLAVKLQEKGLELMIRYDPQLGRGFVGDAGRIRQAVTNLVGNAVKFTERGHVLINVGGRRRGEIADVEIAVEDTGCGIPPDKLGTIFEAFEQADGSAARRHDGAGLGLAITRRLVEAMGGAVVAESVVGEGSAFRLRLAVRVDERAGSPDVAPGAATGLRALVVDDNRVNLEILKEQLSAWGMSVSAFPAAAAALEAAKEAAARGAPFDIAILDHQMPETDGVMLARRLRTDGTLRDMPIVLLTSAGRKGDPGDRVLSLFDAYLVKPARASLFYDAIVSSLNARARAEAREAAAALDDAAQHRRAMPTAPVLRVLVAEDNVVNQMVAASMLDALGCETRLVADGVEAIAAFQAYAPDLVLMDISMPGLDGAEATRRIREIEKARGGARTPIIGVTAHAMKEDRARCLEAGMDDHLPKPIKREPLRAMLALWSGAFRDAKSA